MTDESREPWLEALLQKALDEGDVSRLGGHGKPLASLDGLTIRPPASIWSTSTRSSRPGASAEGEYHGDAAREACKLMSRKSQEEKIGGGWLAKGEATGRVRVEAGSKETSTRFVVKRRLTKDESHSARIRGLYQQIQYLILTGGADEAIALKRQELRRFQQLEAERMTRRAERRSHLAAGRGYALLEKASRLLAK